jgi:hypothetical protein
VTRNRRSARQAGTQLERLVANYLARHINPDIDRRPKTGAKDKGDIGGLRHMGRPIVVECKNTTRLNLGPWLTEAEVERGNADATVGMVVFKRHGKAAPGDQLVLMTLADLVALLTGGRPNEEEDT